MAKFLSFDGIDKDGVRAEVMVQTGTGKIREILPKGKAAADGSYRNVEVVFDPDNPKLVRKVYASLDTTSKELWEYVQAAHKEQRDISYRIESQRKRTVDRKIKFEDLRPADDVVRVLAGIDSVFSHEAKSNPAEDPTNGAPSALQQELNSPAQAPQKLTTEPSSPAPSVSPARLLAELAKARQLNLSATIIDTLVANTITAGATLEEALAAGIGEENITPDAPSSIARGYAVEEKPWTAYNSDGRVNPGSYMVAHAAAAERFSLDHLIKIYSEGKKSNVDVTDEMISQAASLALVLLEMSDEVQKRVSGRVDRQKNSYNRAMALVLDAVDKRYVAPIGGNSEAQTSWRATVMNESMERFNGILAVADGRLPIADTFAAEEAKPEVTNGAAALKATLGAVEKVAANVSFPKPKKMPVAGDSKFEEPTQDAIAALRDLCSNVGVTTETRAISNWLEAALGVRVSRKIHAPVLAEFVAFYAVKDAEEVKKEILSHG
jgi:hypothetical protein